MTNAAIVLCGGRSTRMGRAKAWLPWRGKPMITHVVEALREVGTVDEVIVVSSAAQKLPPLDALVVPDRRPALGPLAGIREGLAHLKADLAYTTSTDAPFLTPRFVSAMLARGGAAAPEVDGYVQTLAAVYPRCALSQADELLAANELRPVRLLEAIGFQKLAADELPDIESIHGFNTPSEYLQAVEQDSPHGTAVIELRGAALRAATDDPLSPRTSAGTSGSNRAPAGEWVVAVGTLGEALAQVPGRQMLDGDQDIAPAFSVELASGESIRNAGVPIGPGERVVVKDASM